MDLKKYIGAHTSAVGKLLLYEDELKVIGDKMFTTLEQGGTIYFCGNGGSAADAQHLAAELVGTFTSKKRQPLSAIALTTDSSCLTSISNDFAFEKIYARQIEAHCRNDDLVFFISTSGNSANLIKGAQICKERRINSVGLLGKSGGELRKHVDIPVIVESDETSIIQECHIVIGHYLCYIMDELYSD